MNVKANEHREETEKECTVGRRIVSKAPEQIRKIEVEVEPEIEPRSEKEKDELSYYRLLCFSHL